jgi:hypothetical protein
MENKKFRIVGRDSTLGVTLRNQSKAFKTTESAGTQATLVAQIGTEAGKTLVFAGKAQLQDPASRTEQGGVSYYQGNFAFRSKHTAATAEKPVIIRF